VTLFWILALLTVPAALTVVLHKNPVYSALALVFTLFQVAIMFVALDAYLIAFLQVIVYAGAIVILILFAIMLLSLEPEVLSEKRPDFRPWGWGLAGLLGIELCAVAMLELPVSSEAGPAGFGSVESVAQELFSTYLLPFELTSFLLLAAVVGAVVLARRRS